MGGDPGGGDPCHQPVLRLDDGDRPPGVGRELQSDEPAADHDDVLRGFERATQFVGIVPGPQGQHAA
jgi:hypothetical protein